ncbi:MAG: RES family NAD+ phosphorylase [Candidatus Puniceispirillales bacterium WSBS_2018_MAG_OTU23]
MKLVDNVDEQILLEQMLENTKPSIPKKCAKLDYLLFTPFRYVPGEPTAVSRFRDKGQNDGVFYSAFDIDTAVAEMTFYRMLFFAESPGTNLPTNPCRFTAFAVPIKTSQALDLTVLPLSKDAALWTHKTNYAPCLQLAVNARNAGIDCIISQSVRDPKGGKNASILDCGVFTVTSPDRSKNQTWDIFLKPGRAEAICRFPDKTIGFLSSNFGDSRLATYPSIK